MIIGVDGNEANVDRRVGVSVYAHALLHYFAQNATADRSFIVYVREEPKPHMPPASEHFSYRIVHGRRFWRDVFFPAYLYMHNEANVLFCPAHYAPRWSPIPTVVTIHDVAYEYFPGEFLKKDLYKLRQWTSHALHRSAAIIAVSHSTKSDITKFYGIDPSRISVIHHGYQKPEALVQYNGNSDVYATHGLEKGAYYLYVGTLQPRKNIATLIRAFAHVKKKQKDVKLAIAGRKGWLFDQIFEEVRSLSLEDDVIFTGFVSDNDLSQLYKGAIAYVLPSLYEGFGLPVLEAMSNDCPVITSKVSSLPEVGGDAAIYVNPKSVEDVADKMLTIAQNDRLRREFIAKGRVRVKKFSTKRMTQETLDLITRTAASA